MENCPVFVCTEGSLRVVKTVHKEQPTTTQLCQAILYCDGVEEMQVINQLWKICLRLEILQSDFPSMDRLP